MKEQQSFIRSAYQMTDEIRTILSKDPDVTAVDSEGRKFVVVYGTKVENTDPPHAAFCIVTTPNGFTKEIIGGGKTKDDALKAVGFDIFQTVRLTESYHRQLGEIEQRFAIDLSSSKKIPIAHVQQVRSLGHRVAHALKGHKTDDELDQIHRTIDSFLVLTDEDRRHVEQKAMEEGLQALESVKQHLEKNGTWDAIEAEHRIMYKQQVNQFTQAIAFTQSSEFGPASKFGYTDVDGTTSFLCTFSDWSVQNFFDEQTLEGAVTEETLHLASQIQHSEVTDRKNLYWMEEYAVEYYVVNAMRMLGIKPEKIDRYASLNPDCYIVWERFIEEVGQEKADMIFFQGGATNEDVQRFSNLANQIAIGNLV